MLASRLGHLPVVQAHLEAHADVNAPDGDGKTALTGAVHFGHVSVAQLLLAAGAVGPRDYEGWPALLSASAMGNLPFVHTLYPWMIALMMD